MKFTLNSTQVCRSPDKQVSKGEAIVPYTITRRLQREKEKHSNTFKCIQLYKFKLLSNLLIIQKLYMHPKNGMYGPKVHDLNHYLNQYLTHWPSPTEVG